MTTDTTLTLPCIEINPEIDAKHSIIWLHGLGADGSDFVPLVPELQLPSTLAIRFIFPHAPIMPVTINNGYKMRAWFDIYDMNVGAKIDTTNIERSVSELKKLIAQEEARGIASSNIILAGFSQGAVIALHTGLCYTKPLAGILALSGFLPQADNVLAKTSTANKQIPIFLAHGTEDPIVPYVFGKATYAMLKQAGYPVTWHSYAMQHAVCGEEVGDISQWIARCFLAG